MFCVGTCQGWGALDCVDRAAAAYEARPRDPVCGSYRVYRICGMGPPSSGQVAVQQIMGVLETQDMAAMKPGPDAAHWIAEAGRLALVERDALHGAKVEAEII